MTTLVFVDRSPEAHAAPINAIHCTRVESGKLNAMASSSLQAIPGTGLINLIKKVRSTMVLHDDDRVGSIISPALEIHHRLKKFHRVVYTIRNVPKSELDP